MTGQPTHRFFERAALDPARIRAIAQNALAGMDDGELFLEVAQSENLTWDDGRLRNAAFDVSQGFGLRSVLGEAVAYAHASELSEEAIARALTEGWIAAAGLDVTGSHNAHALHSPYWWIKCAVGVDNDENFLARTYHRFLAWDITHPSRAVRFVEHTLDPLIGKSLVMYATKPAARLARPKEPARAAA